MITNNTFKQILTDIAKMPYYKNCSACSGLTTAPPNHELAIEQVLNSYNMFQFNSIKLKKKDKLDLNTSLISMPNFTYISQPFGSHDSPDFIIKDENGIILCLEAKSSTTVYPLYNSGGIHPHYIYIFCSEKTNQTVIYKGSDIISEQQHRLITEHIQLQRQQDIELNKKLAELDTNNRGISYYTRPMIGQKGEAVKTNYFTHQNKDTARNNVLNYIL
tara:strand:- start:4037 stop:4690 length:654 start_codon:yes stop_codon:yes gene_type:complete